MRAEDVERFWSKVDKSGGPEACWLWTTGRFSTGYGQFKLSGKPVGAHRIAYELASGPVTAGLFVCHRCDNPPCCNPAHLFLGTQLDNVRDMDAKGRRRWNLRPLRGADHPLVKHPERVARGSRHGAAKLTESDVVRIRARSAEGLDVLAMEFGVTRDAVSLIVRRKTWRHV